MSTRFDDYIDFHNPTRKPFVGRWEQEDYIVAPGETKPYPAWLARHFAKRLCDQVMIQQYGEPLRPDHKKRKEFMEVCLKGQVVVFDEDKTPKTTKEQIEERAANMFRSPEQKIAALQKQINDLAAHLTTGAPLPVTTADMLEPADNDPSLMADEAPGDETDDDEDIEDLAPADDADDDLTKEEREVKAAAEVKAEAAAMAKANKAGKLRNIPNPTGRRQRLAEKKDSPAFEGDEVEADSKTQNAFQQQLQQDSQ